MSATESVSAQLRANRQMRALRAHARGGPDKLVYEEAPVPPVGLNGVLVRVHAASITPTELTWPSTWEDRAGHDRLPTIPSHEVAGVVTELGYGTTGVATGAKVYGLTDWYRNGAAADYLAVEARDVAPMPATSSFVEAAAIPLAGLTAWQGLFDHGHLTAGQTVLIHGAAGGVGTFAVQLAHALGARVIGTGHAWSRELVAGLGADQYIDLNLQLFEEAAGKVDLVLDLIGGDLLKRSWAVVKPGGAIVSVVEDPRAAGPVPAHIHPVFFVVVPDRAELIELARQVDARKLKPIVGGVMPLARGREAFAAKQAGHVSGKMVLTVAADADDTPRDLASAIVRTD
jgi:NADPH:quinone reductase-like Zn-dependent oxidoreductase